MTTAVMPAQKMRAQAGAKASVEHALEVGGLLLRGEIVFGIVITELLEEIGGRQLLVVAGDDDLLAAQDRSNGVFGANLRGLVEHHQVELDFGWVEKLA